MAVKEWAPVASAAVLKLQAPVVVLAVVVPRLVVPSKTVTIALASALPLTVIVVALVTPSVPERPVSVAMPLMLGAAGAVVSIVALKADEATPVLPARSCAVAR